jgi:DNA primase
MIDEPDNASPPLPPGMLADLIAETVPLRQCGSDAVSCRGTCPFHPDSTMSLYAHQSGWYCFVCQAGGDAVEWMMHRNKVGRDDARTLLQQYLNRFR